MTPQERARQLLERMNGACTRDDAAAWQAEIAAAITAAEQAERNQMQTVVDGLVAQCARRTNDSDEYRTTVKRLGTIARCARAVKSTGDPAALDELMRAVDGLDGPVLTVTAEAAARPNGQRAGTRRNWTD